MRITSRTRGETEVYRGPQCPNGHDGLRYNSTGQCVQCKRESGRKGSKSRGSLSDAVRKQARWVKCFEKNFKAVSKLGILRVLSRDYHKTEIQGWLYRMRTRWNEHPTDRQARLISLGERKWWLRIDPPRHQTRTGFLVGSVEHQEYKRTVRKGWREINPEKVREYYTTNYKNNPRQHEKAAAARLKRYRENPGLAAFLTSSRRKRVKAQRCNCCTDQEIRAVYLRNGSRRLDTDHKISLAVATELGLKGMHCVSNLQGLKPDVHRKKTTADQRKRAAIRRAKGLPYHNRLR